MPIDLDSRGNLILGPATSQPTNARIRTVPSQGDTTNVGLQVDASPTDASERAAIKVGDFTFQQDSGASGTKDLVILDGSGNTVQRLSNGSIPFSTSYGVRSFRLHNAIPFIYPGSYTAADDGAITLGTALPTTYAACFMYFALGGLYAASPAGWYYTVMTNTTVGAVKANTYTAGTIPSIPATITAIVATGAGAVAGGTAELLMPSITIPAAALALGHKVRAVAAWAVENTVDVKTARIRWSGLAGTVLVASTLTSLTGGVSEAEVWNRGAANKQIISGRSFYDGTTLAQAAVAYGTIDTSVATTLVFTAAKAAATNNAVLEGFTIEIDQ